MLLITNGKFIVDPAMNEENLAEVINDIQTNVFSYFEKEIEFEKIEKPFLMYKIPEDLNWRNFKESVPANCEIKLMGIGADDEVTIPYPVLKVIDYHFAIEELNKIGDDMCDILEEITKIENEKKSVNKRLSEEISQLQTRLNAIAKLHRQGFETREIKCYCIMSFKERIKKYHDIGTGELLHSESMTTEDQRTLFDVKGFDLDNIDEVNGFDLDEVDIDDNLEDPNDHDANSEPPAPQNMEEI